MDHTPAQELADKVAACILRSGRTKTSVADAAGIPHTTFNRKIKGHTEFTFAELLRIAAVLNVAPSTFTPYAFAVAS
ncbi:helix-turn-helix domain-containing protein [Humibacter ginsenosidimutans]|uniref:Helix-turn-helix transcriptional regulator n=1 Tax=Humibacter ginsenosidimutans TaxID=2599293 RepID=A0A5B8M822_9MICO|nr:helix-turn-helix domain-containing protein [Humibacter ginsenosidimutans]QDZ15815.1 helix-turn-helix transcriptional regulator [Humibacter ginsenosidimutans]